ncbi:MAG: hypothetical protein CMM02_06555 [Rhodopirellula sp.]|nr:hypothetical protein [Rhodopirellula sp.]
MVVYDAPFRSYFKAMNDTGKFTPVQPTTQGSSNIALPFSAIGLVILTSACWGGNPVAAKYSLFSEETLLGLPPLTVSGIRFAMATLFMVVWCQIAKEPIKLARGQLGPCFLAGTLLFAQIATFTIGVHLTNSTHTTILINTYIIWVLIFEHFFTGNHRITKIQLFGCLLAGTSALVTLIIKSSHDNTPTTDQASIVGDMIIILSAFILAIKILFIKASLTKVPSGTIILWHDFIGVLWFIPTALFFESEQVSIEQVNDEVIGGLVYQGIIVGGMCFAVQTMLLKKYSATRISVFSFLTPLFGISAAAIFRDDPLSSWIFVSLILVASGIYLVNRQQPQ